MKKYNQVLILFAIVLFSIPIANANARILEYWLIRELNISKILSR